MKYLVFLIALAVGAQNTPPPSSNASSVQGLLPCTISRVDNCISNIKAGSSFGAPSGSVAWKGAYAAGTTYGLYDGVSDGGTSYASLQAGNVGHTPASSPTYWVVVAAKGDTGAAGNDGSNGTNGTNGTNGAAGAAATIAVGTVTTGAAGSSASVTNVGTSSAAVFDIAIPRGDTGASGSGTGDVLGAASIASGRVLFGSSTASTLTSDAGISYNASTDSLGVSGDVTVGQTSVASGKVKYNGITSGTVTVQPADAAGTWSLTLPANDGDAGQHLQTNGSGVASWAGHTRVCEIHIWGSGASQVLQDADDEAASCYNGFGVTETVTAVSCWANAGSPTVTPIVTGGSGLLTGALTCGTASFAAGTLSGTPTIASGGTIDANVTTAGGTATNIRLVVTLTR